MHSSGQLAECAPFGTEAQRQQSSNNSQSAAVWHSAWLPELFPPLPTTPPDEAPPTLVEPPPEMAPPAAGVPPFEPPLLLATPPLARLPPALLALPPVAEAPPLVPAPNPPLARPPAPGPEPPLAAARPPVLPEPSKAAPAQPMITLSTGTHAMKERYCISSEAHVSVPHGPSQFLGSRARCLT